ncbi:MAG: hypothetical protein IJR95_03340 [Lachnospiraceae bacterium]|nr:hypothetical protein [Lachnospiraceae bacterium]
MNIKKLLASILAVILIITALPGTALAASNFTPKWASGYYPTGGNTPLKYYSCYLGGNSNSITADMSYGDSSKTLRVDMTAHFYAFNTLIPMHNYNTGFGTAIVNFTLINDYYFTSAMSYYRIRTNLIANLMIP